MELKTPNIMIPCTPQEAETFLSKGLWCFQEFKAGELALVRFTESGEILALDKMNDPLDMSNDVAAALALYAQGQPLSMLGVLRGDRLFVFDLVEYAGMDMQILQYKDRYQMLVRVLSLKGRTAIDLIPAYFVKSEKIQALNHMGRIGKGIVIKSVKNVLTNEKQYPMFKLIFEKPDAKILAFPVRKRG